TTALDCCSEAQKCFESCSSNNISMITVIRVVFMVLTLGVGGRGFVVTPGARRWRPDARRGGFRDTATAARRLQGRSTASPEVVNMSIREMIGADVETGGLFDPLGFSKDEPALFRRRAVELKHGRVSMLAVTGILVQSFVRFPGFPPFPVSDVARPLALMRALWSADKESVLLALLAVGVVELTIGKQDYVERAPGELGEFGAFAKPVDRDEWEKVQMAELKHGRLAMLGVVGCLAQELVTGEGPLEQISKGNVRP
ncbi:unnamed protein product, partial [Scytosiphon promiscuus]